MKNAKYRSSQFKSLFVQGLGRIVLVQLKCGEIHLHKASRKLGEWKNREAYNKAASQLASQF